MRFVTRMKRSGMRGRPFFGQPGFRFAPSGLRSLLKAQLSLQIYRIVKARKLTLAEAASVLGIKQPHVSAPMRWPRRQFLGRATVGIPHSARAGRADYGEADKEAGGGDGSGGVNFVARIERSGMRGGLCKESYAGLSEERHL